MKTKILLMCGLFASIACLGQSPNKLAEWGRYKTTHVTSIDLAPGLYNLVPGQYNFLVSGSPTPTPTPMPTPTPTPDGFTIGETNVFSTDDGGNGGLVLVQDVVLPQVGTIQSLSFYVAAPAGTLSLGLYDSTGPGGSPGKLAASTASFTPVLGWNTQPVTVKAALYPGTYWLGYVPSSSSLGFKIDHSNGQYQYADGTALPAAYPPSKGGGSGHWSFYASFHPGGNPTPTPTPAPTPVPTPTPPAGANHISWFGSACAGNVNWTYSGNQPVAQYFRMLQPDGFQGWGSQYGFSITHGRGANGQMYDYAKQHGLKARLFLGPAPGGGTSEQSLLDTLNWMVNGAGAMPQVDIWNLSNEPMSQGYGSWTTSAMSGLGGAGATGWDWAIKLYHDVKHYFPHALCGFNQWGAEVPNVAMFNEYKEMNRVLWQNHAIDYIGIEMYYGNFAGNNWKWTQAQIKSGLDAYHAACPGCPIHITEITCVDTNDQEQLALIQGAIAAYKADPLVTAVSCWNPDGTIMDAESGAGSGLFYGTTFRPAYTWLIGNFPLPTPP